MANGPGVYRQQQQQQQEGGDDGDDKKFTQEDVNRILKTEREKLEKKLGDKFSDYDDLKAKAGKVDELKQRLEQIEEDAQLKGKTELEKEKHRAKKELETLQAERDKLAQEREEFKTKLDAEVGAHRTTRARQTLSQHLVEQNVLQEASSDALDGLLNASEIEYGEDGAITAMVLKKTGVRYEGAELSKGAAAYLEDKPYFLNGSPGGGGSKRPAGGGGGGGKSAKPLHEMSTDELLMLDAEQRQRN